MADLLKNNLEVSTSPPVGYEVFPWRHYKHCINNVQRISCAGS